MLKQPEKTLKQLAVENEELTARLEEAEDTLRAIRSGEVDALIVSGADGEQVFTLTGADRPFRDLIEEMNEGALTVLQDGIILYANRRFAEMIKTPLEKVFGSTFLTWLAPANEKIFQSFLQKGANEKHRQEFVLIASDDTQVPINLSVSSVFANEMPLSFCLVVTDLTEQKRNAVIAASEMLAKASLADSNHSRQVLLNVIEDQKQAELSLMAYAERLKNLHRIDQAILQAIDSPEKITHDAIMQLRNVLECQHASVGLFIFEKNEVMVFASNGVDDSIVQTGQVLPEENYGDMRLLKQMKLEVIEDSLALESVSSINKTIQAEGVRSFINAPLESSKGLIGVLNIGWDTPRSITSGELEIVSEVASQISIAIEQARLLRETKRHSEELEQKILMRTAELRVMVNAMAGREVRMVELKKVIRQLRDQLEQSGLTPAADDPLAE